MPSRSPSTLTSTTQTLVALGEHIRRSRKQLGVNAVTAAESAGLSRVTLHRIERGEPSVTMGAYLNLMSVLGLQWSATSTHAQPGSIPDHHYLSLQTLPEKLHLNDYPVLQSLAWHLNDSADVTPEQALALYERHWRHVDRTKLSDHERGLIQALADRFSGGRLLV